MSGRNPSPDRPTTVDLWTYDKVAKRWNMEAPGVTVKAAHERYHDLIEQEGFAREHLRITFPGEKPTIYL